MSATLAERQAARKKKFQQRFAAAGKKKAGSLAKVAERTAQRRGRGFDPLETVIKQATQPPPPPPPKKPTTICDVLGTGNASFGRRGSTVPRGVSFACGGQPIDFSTAFPNNTTVREFGATIQANRAKVKAAGIALPPSQAERANAQRRLKILRKKQRSCGRNTSCIIGFSNQISDLRKEFGI